MSIADEIIKESIGNFDYWQTIDVKQNGTWIVRVGNKVFHGEEAKIAIDKLVADGKIRLTNHNFPKVLSREIYLPVATSPLSENRRTI